MFNSVIDLTQIKDFINATQLYLNVAKLMLCISSCAPNWWWRYFKLYCGWHVGQWLTEGTIKVNGGIINLLLALRIRPIQPIYIWVNVGWAFNNFYPMGVRRPHNDILKKKKLYISFDLGLSHFSLPLNTIYKEKYLALGSMCTWLIIQTHIWLCIC